MKTGYSQAAWRLLEPTLGGTRVRPEAPVPTWADTELAGTPFQPCTVVFPIVRPKGSH
jgi:hypothetical protein